MGHCVEVKGIGFLKSLTQNKTMHMGLHRFLVQVSFKYLLQMRMNKWNINLNALQRRIQRAQDAKIFSEKIVLFARCFASARRLCRAMETLGAKRDDVECAENLRITAQSAMLELID